MAKKSIKTAKKPTVKKVIKKTVKKAEKKAAPKAKKPQTKKNSKPPAKKPAKNLAKAKKPVVKKSALKKSIVKKSIVKKSIVKKVASGKVVSKAKPSKLVYSKAKPSKSASKQIGPKEKVIKHAVNLVAQPRAHKADDKRTRYSDKELAEFKNLIEYKVEAAKAELKYLNDQINRKDDNGTDDTENKFGSVEDGSVAMEREYMSQMATRQTTYIDHLEKALMRIENKTYGICRVTGKLIDKERLRAVPHATLSIEAKMMQSK